MPPPQVGLYLRLSRDDGDGEESMSIANQRAFLLQYADRQGLSVAEAYIDDGYTGTNFDRPAFQRMLRDIASGRINTVVTKDLSRLGRDVIGTMYYYQVFFPRMGVRYLSLSEGIDTAAPSGMSQALPFLAAANDFYTADISRKVRTALSTRKQGGLFIGAQAPLGYQKDPDVKGRLIPDPETAPLVRQIFQEYLSLGSVMGVAKALTEQGVPTPSQLKDEGAAPGRFPGVWSDTMVRRILTNPTYAGHLTQNRSQKINYKVDARRQLPPEAWITVSNTHAPIVAQTDFDRTQEMLRIRSYRPEHGSGGHLLTGLAFCADCGSPMTYVRESAARVYMVCQGYRRGGRLGLCTAHSIREDAVIEAIRSQLQSLSHGLDPQALTEGLTTGEETRRLTRQLERARRQLEECKAVSQNLYTDKATGAVTPEEFRELFDGVRRKRAQCEHGIRAYTDELERAQDDDALRDRLREILSFRQLTRMVLLALVERLVIHEGKEIEIHFRFQRP